MILRASKESKGSPVKKKENKMLVNVSFKQDNKNKSSKVFIYLQIAVPETKKIKKMNVS